MAREPVLSSLPRIEPCAPPEHEKPFQESGAMDLTLGMTDEGDDVRRKDVDVASDKRTDASLSKSETPKDDS